MSEPLDQDAGDGSAGVVPRGVGADAAGVGAAGSDSGTGDLDAAAAAGADHGGAAVSAGKSGELDAEATTPAPRPGGAGSRSEPGRADMAPAGTGWAADTAPESEPEWEPEPERESVPVWEATGVPDSEPEWEPYQPIFTSPGSAMTATTMEPVALPTSRSTRWIRSAGSADGQDWAWVEQWRRGGEPTPWGPGLALAAFAALLIGSALYVIGSGLGDSPWLRVGAHLVVLAGVGPALWMSRGLPVLRWISLGGAVGLAIATLAAVFGP